LTFTEGTCNVIPPRGQHRIDHTVDEKVNEGMRVNNCYIRRKLVKVAVSLLIGGTLSDVCIAQDKCVALLRYGINNTVRSEQAGSSASTAYSQICSSYNSYKSGTLHADASGKYGVISGQASFTKNEIESIGQAMCSTSYNDAQAKNQTSNFSSVVSPAGLDAFRDCVHATEHGLALSIDFDEAAPEIVTISAHLSQGTGNPSTAQQYVSPTLIDSSAPAAMAAAQVTCSGPLFDAGKEKKPITGAELVMTCRRPVENDPSKTFPIAGKLGGIAFPASITVPTDLGAIKFLYGALFLPPASSPIIPAFAGEIRSVAFQSNDSAYITLRQNGWIECDGSPLSIEDYPELYKALGYAWGTSSLGSTFKLPDLRGQFLRGWSHGTTGDPEAPSRTVADPGNPNQAWGGASGDHVGSQQGDAFQVHAHAMSDFINHNPGVDENSGHIGALFNHSGSTSTTGPISGKTSAAETRPKNVAVMFVIYTGRIPKT
jgi:Phage Tail Collar Domain